MSELQKSILKTLVYFDILDYPLNKDEVWNYLFVEMRLIASLRASDIKIGLDELCKQKKIDQKDGFYFLSDRDEIVEIRKQRCEISLKKIKKAQRVIWWLRFIPWTKAVFICSGLGLLNADEEADIDLLIITSRNKIWSARWWSAGILKLLNLRPKNGRMKDKFCLSHFITEDNLNLEQTKIQEDDMHLIYLLSYYLPLYFEDNLWQRFIEANSWIKKYLPNFSYPRDPSLPAVAQDDIRVIWLKKLIRKLQFNWEEKLYKKIQLKIMPAILKQMMNQDKRVIVNDNMLKLHTNDSRQMVYEKWTQKYNEIIK